MYINPLKIKNIVLYCIVYGFIFHGLTSMLMSKNENNDVTMNPGEKTHISKSDL